MMLLIPGWDSASLEQYARAEAVKDFEKLVATLDKGEVQVTTRIEVGRPAAAIVRLASEGGADMVVMGTHGRTGLKHALLGSVAEKVVRKAPCAVLTVRAPGHRFEHP